VVEPETEDGRRRRRSRGPKPAKRVNRTEKINREDKLTRNRSWEHWPIIIFAAAPKPGLKRGRENQGKQSIKGRRRQVEGKNNRSVVQARHYHRLRLHLPASGKCFLIPRFPLPYNSFALLQ